MIPLSDHNHEQHHGHDASAEKFLVWRNIFAGIAAVLFLISLTHLFHNPYLLKAIAYFCGFVAYGAEVLFLTKGFKHKEPMKEMFMPYVFTVLYVVLGISYLGHH